MITMKTSLGYPPAGKLLLADRLRDNPRTCTTRTLNNAHWELRRGKVLGWQRQTLLIKLSFLFTSDKDLRIEETFVFLYISVG